jgi:methanogenic corrinoid protein MtbC1
MAGAAERRMDRPAAWCEEAPLSDKSNKVVRLPRAPDSRKSTIADEDARRQRLTDILTRLVERDVVPRLMSGRADTQPASGLQTARTGLLLPPKSTPIPDDAPTQDAIVAFADTLLKGAPGDAAAIVATLRESGVSAETLSLHLLTGAARHLGALWEADIVSFSDVTIATDELQALFRDLAPAIVVLAKDKLSGSAMLVSAPGEQHSFGLTMLAAFFRASGWSAVTPRVRGLADIQRKVAATEYDLLGFSLGAELHLAALGRCIELVRRVSRNRDLIVMVGGPVFLDRPDLAASIGADATASDAPSALEQAEQLVRIRRR